MKQLVYMGPNISNSSIMLTHGTIFKGKLPEQITKKIESDSYFSSLFVSVDGVAKARLDLNKGDTHISNCYARVYAESLKNKKG
ncbi:hypothetical protein REA38_11665 [Serratia sp. MF2]|uniref:hypothetical protein n=1 Tax=Serratia sp. MF1(2023) TaxID=3059171 RepID=UPI0027EB2B61|nr:hypothetical protein [Serratia sp. MF1(2023)]MDQ7104207.1 hypothetical protein [Serratia sp. MF1(2023)]